MKLFELRWRTSKAISFAMQRVLNHLGKPRLEVMQFLDAAVDWERIRVRRGDRAGLVGYSLRTKFQTTRFLLDEEDLDWFRRENPFGSHQETLAEANRSLANHIRLPGIGLCDCGPKIDWSRDPRTGARFPHNLFSVRPDWNIDGRFRTELNLHRHFPVLAAAWQVSGRPEYAEKLTGQLGDWIRSNPPIDDPFLNDGLETTIRLWCWTHCFFLLSAAPVDSHDYLAVLARIHRLTRLVERNYHARPSANNHQVAEAFCLFFVGLLYPEFRESKRWLTKGIQFLAENLEAQFLPGGVHGEQASTYHFFVLEICLLTILLSRRNGIALAGVFETIAENAAEYVLYVTKPDGTYPQIGDTGIRFFSPAGGCSFNPRVLLALSAVLFQRPDMARSAERWTEEAFWIAGRSQKFHSLLDQKVIPAHTRKLWQAAGHFVVRSDWSDEALHLHFDFGPQGLGPRTGHSHDDALSLDLHAFGQAFLVDTGTYTYVHLDPIREYFRGARSHNAILLDGEGPARTSPGQFGWQKTVTAEMTGYRVDGHTTCLSAAHTAFSDRESEITVERSVIVVRNSYLFIVDCILGSGPHRIESLFHLHPDISVTERQGALLCIGPAASLKVQAMGSSSIKTSVHAGPDPESPGWFSPEYGVLVSAPVVRFQAEAIIPYHQVLSLIPCRNSDLNSVSARLSDPTGLVRVAEADPPAVAMTVEDIRNGSTDIMILNSRGCPIHLSDIETDARVVLLQQDRQGKKAWVFHQTYCTPACDLAVQHLD